MEKKYLSEDDGILCSSLEEAKKVINIYHILGYRWPVIPKSKNETYYSTFEDETVYSIKDQKYITYGSFEVATCLCPNIISAEKFIKYYTKIIMKEKNIKVTSEQAMEWYNNGNETLRTLALTAFTEEELTPSIEYILKEVQTQSLVVPMVACEASKVVTMLHLALVAKYFNGNWKKTPYNTGYFLGQTCRESSKEAIKGMKGVKIITHTTVMYPGVVYFKNSEDIIKAIRIIGDDIKYLFT